MRKPNSVAMGMVISAATRKPPMPGICHSNTQRMAICAAMAPMVMAKLMPMPATMGMMSDSTMKALRAMRSTSSIAT